MRMVNEGDEADDENGDGDVDDEDGGDGDNDNGDDDDDGSHDGTHVVKYAYNTGYNLIMLIFW